MSAATEFRFDGGATWLNLLATRGQTFGTRPVERLTSPESGARWLTLVGLAPDAAFTTADLNRLVTLRDFLREVAMAAVAGLDPSPEARAHIDATAAATTFASEVQREGVAVQTALGLIAVQALVTLRGPDRELLKECAETDCRWVFLDTSGRRHWCPSPACASRGRVRAHRARQG